MRRHAGAESTCGPAWRCRCGVPWGPEKLDADGTCPDCPERAAVAPPAPEPAPRPLEASARPVARAAAVQASPSRRRAVLSLIDALSSERPTLPLAAIFSAVARRTGIDADEIRAIFDGACE